MQDIALICERMNSPHSSEARLYALIPCAGAGSRAQTEQPKQYQRLLGVPMVIHALRAFEAVPSLTQGVVVVAPQDTLMADVLRTHPQLRFQVCNVGGATRAHSVLAGLHSLAELGARTSDWVLVHDAARCLITPELIQSLITACQNDTVGGLLALPLADTLKSEHNGRVAQTLERNHKWLAHTPQMFRLGDLMHALQQAHDSPQAHSITDEASAMELLGSQPKLVESSAQNFKVTYPQDFELAEAVLSTRHNKAMPSHKE